MARYFFNIHDDVLAVDPEGVELANLGRARMYAVHLFGSLLNECPDDTDFEVHDRWRIEVTDDTGPILFILALMVHEAPALLKFGSN